MNASSTRLTPLSLYPFGRRGFIAFLAIAAVAAAQFSGFSAGASQDHTLVNFAKIREEWVRDLHTKQLEPILKFYAPDAAFLQPNGDRIVGSAALRSLFQNIMASFTSDLTLHSRNLEASGESRLRQRRLRRVADQSRHRRQDRLQGQLRGYLQAPAGRQLENRSARLDRHAAIRNLKVATGNNSSDIFGSAILLIEVRDIGATFDCPL